MDMLDISKLSINYSPVTYDTISISTKVKVYTTSISVSNEVYWSSHIPLLGVSGVNNSSREIETITITANEGALYNFKNTTSMNSLSGPVKLNFTNNNSNFTISIVEFLSSEYNTTFKNPESTTTIRRAYKLVPSITVANPLYDLNKIKVISNQNIKILPYTTSGNTFTIETANEPNPNFTIICEPKSLLYSNCYIGNTNTATLTCSYTNANSFTITNIVYSSNSSTSAIIDGTILTTDYVDVFTDAPTISLSNVSIQTASNASTNLIWGNTTDKKYVTFKLESFNSPSNGKLTFTFKSNSIVHPKFLYVGNINDPGYKTTISYVTAIPFVHTSTKVDVIDKSDTTIRADHKVLYYISYPVGIDLGFNTPEVNTNYTISTTPVTTYSVSAGIFNSAVNTAAITVNTSSAVSGTINSFKVLPGFLIDKIYNRTNTNTISFTTATSFTNVVSVSGDFQISNLGYTPSTGVLILQLPITTTGSVSVYPKYVAMTTTGQEGTTWSNIPGVTDDYDSTTGKLTINIPGYNIGTAKYKLSILTKGVSIYEGNKYYYNTVRLDIGIYTKGVGKGYSS
jgi:hypothetical protein